LPLPLLLVRLPPRERFRRNQKWVGPCFQTLGKRRIQLIEILWTDGMQQDV